MGLPLPYDSGWGSLAEIITREWFSRVWVVQEMTVARQHSFLYGRHIIDPDDIKTIALNVPILNMIRDILALDNLGSSEWCIPTFHVSIISNIAATYGEKGPFAFHESLLYLASPLNATDPRDKIFALIGITSDGPSELIDYKRSLRELLIDVCTRFLKAGPWSGPPLDILSYVHHEVQQLGLPSWVPSWNPENRPILPLSPVIRPKEWIKVGTGSFSILDEVQIWSYDALLY